MNIIIKIGSKEELDALANIVSNSREFAPKTSDPYKEQREKISTDILCQIDVIKKRVGSDKVFKF